MIYPVLEISLSIKVEFSTESVSNERRGAVLRGESRTLRCGESSRDRFSLININSTITFLIVISNLLSLI